MKIDYEKKISGVAPGRFAVGRVLKLVKGQKGKFLDIGCGKGEITKCIKKSYPDLEVYGCDVSKKAIKLAKRNPQGVHFMVAESHDLPFKDGFFYSVYMSQVLEHLEDLNGAIQEAKRVLKRKGFFYSITPLEGSPFTLQYWIRKNKKVKQSRDGFTGHVYAFPFKGLKEVIERNEFLIKDAFFSDFLLCQLVDSFYHPLLAISGKDSTFSFRGCYIDGREAGFKRESVVVMKSILEALFEAENVLGQKFKIPGFMAHIKAVKT